MGIFRKNGFKGSKKIHHSPRRLRLKVLPNCFDAGLRKIDVLSKVSSGREAAIRSLQTSD
jgi:hypothetical protein